MSDLNDAIGDALVDKLGEDRATKLQVIWHREFTTDGNAMLSLLAAMRELGWAVDIDNSGLRAWSVAILDGVQQLAWELAPTLPEAVARAAAAALGVAVEAETK